MAAPKREQSRARLRKIGSFAAAGTIVVVLLVTLVMLKPAMPDRIRLLTGPAGSAYHELGQRLAAQLEEQALGCELIVTAGGLDNIRKLASAEANTVAFAPSTVGSDMESNADDLVSLGSVGFEPLWLFYRTELDIRRVTDLTGLVVATEGPDTVGAAVAAQLLAHNGIAAQVELHTVEPDSGDSIVDAILNGAVDAGFVTGTSSTPLVQELLHATGVSFVSFDRADAYAALIPGITTLTIPEGVFDLEQDVPPQAATLLSAATTLVATTHLSPAVAPMVLVAARDIGEDRTVFVSDTEFPSSRHLGFPLARSARRYFDQGQTGLSKLLPYNVTRWLNHLGFLVLPLLGLAVVLIKLVPAALTVWCRMRLVGLLKKLEAVEKANAEGGDPVKLQTELDRIDQASAKMFVSRSTVHDYIDFRQFLHDMRERVVKG